jgi:ADP-ribosylglycohydrolase
MVENSENILSKILKKRIETLGYSSLKKFSSDRKDLGLSYELLRQVIYNGRIPRSETLLRILQAMRFSPSQARKVMEMHYRGYIPQEGVPNFTNPDPSEEGTPKTPDGTGDAPPEISPPTLAGEGERQATALTLHDPSEISACLARSLAKIPLQGNEDLWEIVRHITTIVERKAKDLARRREDQPLLFGKEPEPIYQFLVRRSKIPAYLSKGEHVPLSFVSGIDYADRFRGALLGAAIGEALGRPAQGLSPRDIGELYGQIDGYAPLRMHGREHETTDSPPASLLLCRALLRQGKIDPEEIAILFATAPGRPRGGSEAEFAGNLTDRGYPWFEAGINSPESAPAARITPLSLLRSVDFRRMKLEAGIVAAITHPNPAAIAGAIVQATAIARMLHTPSGTLDVLGFARGISPAITGIEPDRAARSRQGRQSPTLSRKVGTELAALLLRRAGIEEIREALGNGVAVQEGLPFAWACFLRSPEDFAEAVLPAVNLGNDAENIASMAGSLCGAYLGASAIPIRFLENLPWREELAAAADELLSMARLSNQGS